jgi:hypothetical protein
MANHSEDPVASAYVITKERVAAIEKDIKTMHEANSN